MKIITNNEISLYIDGKSAADVQKLLVEKGASIGYTSVKELIRGSKKIANGFTITEGAEEPVDLFEVQEEPTFLIPPAPALTIQEQIEEAILETEDSDEVIEIQVTMRNPWASLIGDDVKNILKQVQANTPTEAAVVHQEDDGSPREKLLIAFRAANNILVGKVEAIPGTRLMRAAQGKILLLKNDRWNGGYWHLNIRKNGYSLSAYGKNSHAIGEKIKEHSLDDIVSAYASEVAKFESQL